MTKLAYNINFNIAGLIILATLGLIVSLKYNREKKNNLMFLHLIIFLMIADTFDIVSAITISYSKMVPLWLNYFANCMYFASSIFCAYFLLIYIKEWAGDRSSFKGVDLVNTIISVVYFAICISSPFSKLVFYFDEELNYCQGPLFYSLYILTAYYLLFSLTYAIKNRVKMTNRVVKAVCFFIGVVLCGTILQLTILNDYVITYFFASVSTIVIFLTLETPDYTNLIKAMKELEISRKQLEESQEKDKEKTHIIHTIMKMASWVIYFNDAGEVIDGAWSDEILWMLGYESGEIEIAKYNIWAESLHPDDKEAAMEAFSSGMTGLATYDTKYRLRNKSGDYKWYRGSGEAIRDENGKLISYQGFIQDIQDEIEKENLTQEKLHALAELEKSETALKEALVQAENANKAKSRFLSNMSHDIRTPMNAIVGFTDLAKTNVNNPDTVMEYLDRIQASGDHLLMLINDILDMSRIESGKVELNPEDTRVSDVISNIKNIFQLEAEKRNISYICEIIDIKDNYIKCDRLRLNQILINCVGNSMKFTPEGGSVEVKVSQSGNNYSFVISDTGVGMSEEFLKNIFEPFEREKTSTISKTQGTGLGMSITKSIVDMMGGTVLVESKQGVGTKFNITIPFEVSEIQNSDNEVDGGRLTNDISLEEKTEALKGKRFLIVDDNKANRMVASGILNAFGMLSEEAEDGKVALGMYEQVVAGYYDAILMDLQMPVMDGFEATDIIRALSDAWKANICVIAMTANAFEEDKEECMAHKLDGHISKPFRKEELINTLYSLLC